MNEAPPPLAAMLLWVAIGAVPGALLRWWLANTSAANLLGCFVVGASGLLAAASPRRTLLVGIGFAGSLTSFSSWIVELLGLLQGGRWGQPLRHALRDGVLGVGAILAGHALHARLSVWRAQRLRR
ncbi:MAG: CrcB family protein [Cyanobacteriota bacterium]|nr:CrcB family protein [Cyanobacteriota bacterium]